MDTVILKSIIPSILIIVIRLPVKIAEHMPQKMKNPLNGIRILKHIISEPTNEH
jgi:hypothetical protein